MLHRYSEVLNLPVICADNGKKAGVVKDILFDLENREVKALLLEHTGFMPGKRLVLVKELLSLGNDAAFISDAGHVANMSRKVFKAVFSDRGDLFGGEKGSLLGRRVYSKGGEELGIVKDVIFNIQSFKIEAFEISDGVLQDIIRGRRLLPLFGRVELGEEVAVVEKEAVEEMKESGGGIKNKLLR